MAFARDHGTCCIVLPLKLGVGMIAMLVSVDSVICVLALFTGDIRFQANGYNLYFYKLPAVFGACGLAFGFVGFLGIYDDKPSWVRVFSTYLFVKVACVAAAALADLSTLQKCDSWLTSAEHGLSENLQLTKLAQAGVCPWARLSYSVGASIIVFFWAYCFFHVYTYMSHLELNPPYAIDFGDEKYHTAGRWRFFQVKDPRGQSARESDPLADDEEEAGAKYGSTEEKMAAAGLPLRYGPDGFTHSDRGAEMART